MTTGRLATVGATLTLALVAGAVPAFAAQPAQGGGQPGGQRDCAGQGVPVRRSEVNRMLAALGVAALVDAQLDAQVEGRFDAQVMARPGTPCPTPPPPPRRSAGYWTSAAAVRGWGEPVRVEEFDGSRLGRPWNVYDAPGHAGRGRRTPAAVSLRDGVMTVTGDSRGNTAGMEWGAGQRYGRWEGRVRAPASDPSYNALLLLWPDAENFPVGGEVDFMEMMDPTRQKTDVFLHYGKRNRQLSGSVAADGTRWHNWAVEWTPTHVTTYLDGREWWRTQQTSAFPPGPMHLCIQLDWFPRSARGPVRTSTMQVDWVKQYALSPAELRETPGRGRR